MSQPLPQANVYTYFSREPEANVAQPEQLRSVAIVPAYQVVRATIPTGAMDENARVDFDLDGSNPNETFYSSVYYDAELRRAPVPNMRAGASVDSDSAAVYLVTGRGTSARTRLLYAERAELSLFQGSGSVAVASEQAVITVASANFDLLFAARGITEVATVPDPTRDNYAVVVFEDFPTYPCFVKEWSGSTLTVSVDARIPAGTETRTFTVTRDPAQYRVVTTAEKAFLPARNSAMSGLESTWRNNVTTAAGACPIYNFDTSGSWTVTIVAGANDAELAVTADADTRAINITLGKTGASLAPAKNTVALINEELATAMAAMYRPSSVGVPNSWCPVVIRSNGSSVSATLTATVLTAFGAEWTGRLQATAAGVTGNAKQVVLQLSPDAEGNASVLVSGNVVIITLGAAGGAWSAAKNTATAINALLASNNAGVEFVRDDGEAFATETIGLFSLGARRNHLGFEYDTFSESQSLLLSGGMAAGSLEIYGGILPFYSSTAGGPNARCYMAYRALRTDLSPAASVGTTGGTAKLTRLDSDTWVSILGSVDLDNPASVFAEQYFQGSNRVPLWILSPAAVNNTTDPWGTQAALADCFRFLRIRPGYHWYVANDDYRTMALTYNFVAGLGGYAPTPLQKSARIYIPTKNTATAPDLFLASGDGGNRSAVSLEEAVMTADFDFVDAGVQAGDIVVIDGLEDYTEGTTRLQDGRYGFVVNEVNHGGSPYTVEFTAELPSGGTTDVGFSVYRPGEDLGEGASFDSAASVAALAARAAECVDARLIKHHVDRYRTVVNGVFREIDGVYMLANLAKMIANHAYYLPVSQLPYVGVTSVYGTSSIYDDETEMSVLSGAGYILPITREGADEGTVYVRRDVTSDTSTSDLRRRSAGVAEDFFVMRVEAVIRPRLGPAVVSPPLLNLISVDLSALVDEYKGNEDIFQVIALTGLRPITTMDQARFGVVDTGVIATFRLVHNKEASAGFVDVTVAQEIEIVVTPGASA